MAKETKSATYTEAVGRRKEAIARVRLVPDSKMKFLINERDLATYFPIRELQETVEKPLKVLGGQAFTISARIIGGGITAQAEALRHGISRALIQIDPGARGKLKAEGLLKRDARVKERKKFGLKKARKAAQWSKR